MVFEFIMVLEFTGFCNLFVDSGFRFLGFRSGIHVASSPLIAHVAPLPWCGIATCLL